MNRKNRTQKQCPRLIEKLLRHLRKVKHRSFRPLEGPGPSPLLSDWMELIACRWRFTENNGITEGFHRKMKLNQRRAYRFKNFQNYRLRVIANAAETHPRNLKNCLVLKLWKSPPRLSPDLGKL